MSIASSVNYLQDISDELALRWPDNHTVNIVCHGHSVPSGYYATPFVDPFHAYPHLLHRALKERFPYAVINVIVTAIGGENSVEGAARFEKDVLCHAPRVLTIDYGLNDRQVSLPEAERAWRDMIEAALKREIKLILLTPTWDQTWFSKDDEWTMLTRNAQQIRALASEYGVALADPFAAFERYVDQGGAAQNLLCHVNHPSYLGHQMIATELSAWFMAR